MLDNWTQTHLEQAIKWHSLIDEDKDAEADTIYEQLVRELGKDGCSELLEFVEESQTNPAPVAKAKKKAGVLNPARHVAKSAETWRCLSNYPLYEVSSYGRVRCIERAKPGDWLKPRYRWFKGMCVPSVVLKDSEGKRCERMIGALLIASGFMEKPKWMKNVQCV